jgi:hypothetical protein
MSTGSISRHGRTRLARQSMTFSGPCGGSASKTRKFVRQDMSALRRM